MESMNNRTKISYLILFLLFIVAIMSVIANANGMIPPPLFFKTRDMIMGYLFQFVILIIVNFPFNLSILSLIFYSLGKYNKNWCLNSRKKFHLALFARAP